jgi:hypothetical protein
MAQVSSKSFDWFADRRIFIAEISELPSFYRPGHFRGSFQFEQVYPDACDVGFTMISDRTGEEVVFAMTSTDMNGDEIAGWRFTPTRESVRRFPRCAGVSALIIND